MIDAMVSVGCVLLSLALGGAAIALVLDGLPMLGFALALGSFCCAVAAAVLR